MSRPVEWSYVQARLQARHGPRPDDADWRSLDGAKTLDRYLERAHAMSLRGFTDRLNSGMTSHAIERILRAEWRAYVAEIAAWTVPEWRPAVRWTAHVPDLVAFDRLRAGERARWMRDDPEFAGLMNAERPIDPLPRQGLPVALPAVRDEGLAERWLVRWRALCPHGTDDKGLTRFIELVKSHLRRLASAGAEEASWPYRDDLIQALIAMFRRYAGTPVALFCHLALIALDLERLRGGLVRRCSFGEIVRGAA